MRLQFVIPLFSLIFLLMDHSGTHSTILNPGEQPPFDPLDFEQDILEKNSNHRQRNALRDSRGLWKDKKIPYVFHSQLNNRARKAVQDAIDDYDAYTCIKFIPRDPKKHPDYVEFTPDKGCYSFVGRNGGRQTVSLGEGCEVKGIAIHEMMHVVGFMHEQSRSDRDDFVTILYQNIPRKLWDQFDKMKSRQENNLGVKYDYNSVMHYGKRAFSANGRDTIVPKIDGVTIGQRRGFSTVDAQKINKLYGCPDKPSVPSGSITENQMKEPAVKTTPQIANISSNVTLEPNNTGKGRNITLLSPSALCSNRRNDLYCNLKWKMGWCAKSIEIALESCRLTCGYCADDQESVQTFATSANMDKEINRTGEWT